MTIELDARRTAQRAAFRHFSDHEIRPYAAEADRQEHLPDPVVRSLLRCRYLGAILPEEWGGLGIDMVAYGLLHEEIGRACSSTRSLMTVHDMVAHAVLRCGSPAQRNRWLPRFATGDGLAAFAVSESEAGSDVRAVEATAERRAGGYVLTGTKKWITGGQLADVYLVLARLDGRHTAFLVERAQPGVSITPIAGMLGLRAAMLADVRFEACELPPESLLGRSGFGVESVVQTALDLGRYTVAWGAVGIGQACVEASLRHADTRRQFGVPLREHQLIRQLIADMVTNVTAARLLCLEAGTLRDASFPSSVSQTLIAKYFAARAAMRAAVDAVQIHGAHGCSAACPAQRYMRDAKIMEIIEGSNQIQQLLIAQSAYQDHARREREASIDSPALRALAER